MSRYIGAAEHLDPRHVLCELVSERESNDEWRIDSQQDQAALERPRAEAEAGYCLRREKPSPAGPSASNEIVAGSETPLGVVIVTLSGQVAVTPPAP